MSAAVVGSRWGHEEERAGDEWRPERRLLEEGMGIDRPDKVVASEALRLLLIEAGRALPAPDPARAARVYRRVLAQIERETQRR